jgi:hypothetical protein
MIWRLARAPGFAVLRSVSERTFATKTQIGWTAGLGLEEERRGVDNL